MKNPPTTIKIILSVLGIVGAFIGGAATPIYEDIRVFWRGHDDYVAKSKQINSNEPSGYSIIDQEWKINMKNNDIKGFFAARGFKWEFVGFERGGRISLAYQGTLDTSFGIGNLFLLRDPSIPKDAMKGEMTGLDCDNDQRRVVKCPIIIAKKEDQHLIDEGTKLFKYLESNQCEPIFNTNQDCRQ